MKDKKYQDIVYHELDFRENNEAKISRLKQPQCIEVIRQLCEIDISKAEIRDGELSLHDYHIHSIDLRDLPKNNTLFDSMIPTLLISECCLIYLSPEKAEEVLACFSSMFTATSLAIVIYEPFRPNDPFGKTMIRNLMTRGIVLQTIERYSDIPQQQHRLASLSFEAKAVDTDTIWRKWIGQNEKSRIDKLEWLDEVEEFELLAKHYCVAWGWRQFQNESTWQDLTALA